MRSARNGVAAIVVAAAGCHAGPPTGTGGEAAVRQVIAQPLPPLDGGRLRTTIVEVSYGPGGSSKPHTHPCPVIGYVLEGALRTQAQGQPEAVYHAGQSFYEAPNSVHAVSANASDRESVRFLAYFTCDNDLPLSRPMAGQAP